MNNFNGIGRLTADTRMNQTQDGTSILGFRIAVDAGYGQNKSTLFMDASLFGKRAESLQPYLEKGQQIGISGELSMDNWINKEGQERQSLRLRVSDVTLLSNKDAQATTANNTTNTGTSQDSAGGASFDDDIPFAQFDRGQLA
jgi:single-strand DNA-binding protein